MTPDLLTHVGEALYGAYWQHELCEALSINERTMRRWKSGQNAIPAGVIAELAILCGNRAHTLAGLVPVLRALASAAAAEAADTDAETTTGG